MKSIRGSPMFYTKQEKYRQKEFDLQNNFRKERRKHF